jgi:hypothetical protein
MDNLENNTPVENSLMSNMEINNYLMEASKWGKFLAIIGYVMMGLLVLVAIVMMFSLSVLSQASQSKFPMGLVGLLYILLAGIYYFPITYLYKFSAQMKQAIQLQNEHLLASGFQNLKSLFKFMGIFTIVMLSVYGLVLIIAVPMAMLFK